MIEITVQQDIEGRTLDVAESTTVNLTSLDRPSTTPLETAPNGGLKAWLQVFGCFWLYFTTWGLLQSYGTFQSFYEGGLLSSSTPTAISWIGTVQSFLMITLGLFSGPFYDKGYFRSLSLSGIMMVVFGLMMTSISQSYYQIFLAQGVCIGIGNGLLFLPSVSLVTVYFSTKRAAATGLASTGSGVGGIVFSSVFSALQPRIGFGWTVRILGFITLTGLLMSYAVMRPKRVTNVDTAKKAWTSDDIPYGIYCAFLFVALVALYVPFFNIQSYADQTLKMDEGSTSHILAVLNVGSVFGRILPSIIADKVGALESSLFCAAVASVLCFSWLAINNVGGLVVFAIAYGCVSGTITGISPAVVANLSSDLTRVGRRIGVCFGLASFGLLIGNPIAASLVGLQATRFERLQVFCGGTMLFSALILCLAILVKRLSSGHHFA